MDNPLEARPLLGFDRIRLNDRVYVSPLRLRQKCAVFLIFLTASIVYFAYYAVYRNTVTFLSEDLKYSSFDAVCLSQALIGSSFVLTVFGGCLGDAVVSLYSVVSAGLLFQLIGAVLLLTSGCLFKSNERDRRPLFFSSLSFEAVSVTLIQASLPVLGAEQIKNAGNSAVHLYFQIYYWFNNIGSFCALLIGDVIIDAENEHQLALMVLGIVEVVVTLICILIFMSGKLMYTVPKKNPDKLIELFKERPVSLLRHLWHVSLVFSFISIASVLHSQIDTTFEAQGKFLTKQINNVELPEKISRLTNDIGVLICLPSFWIIKYILRKRGITCLQGSLNSLQRMSFAMLMLIAAITFSGILEFVRFQSVAPVSILWQIPQYLLQGLAELFIYLPAYFFAFTESPKGLHGFFNGLYLCSRGIGTYISASVIYIMRQSNIPGMDMTWYPANLKTGHFGYAMFLLAGIGTVALFVFMIFSPRYVYAKEKHSIINGLERLDNDSTA
ncbi:uncharacterized protein LOC141903885 [Tubulanus polymorphus]|uniref:uncharacterized protein LOC141903885 n=1 Tax=Tubulanus polymorphus TaxID=672921 RepID=UPI003DA69CB9